MYNIANSLNLLPFMSIHLSCKLMVWVDVGLSSNNSQFIKCTQLADELGKFVTDAIPVFDAITGSDMTSECMNTGYRIAFVEMKK